MRQINVASISPGVIPLMLAVLLELLITPRMAAPQGYSAAFSFEMLAGEMCSIFFNDSSPSPDQVTWSFGDGDSRICDKTDGCYSAVFHCYERYGLYNASIQASWTNASRVETSHLTLRIGPCRVAIDTTSSEHPVFGSSGSVDIVSLDPYGCDWFAKSSDTAIVTIPPLGTIARGAAAASPFDYAVEYNVKPNGGPPRVAMIQVAGYASATPQVTDVSILDDMFDFFNETFGKIEYKIFQRGFYNLSLNKNGNGVMNVVPQGSLECGPNCYRYEGGHAPPFAEVSLSATPDAGWIFSHWDGEADCGTGIVTMDADVTCTAIFSRQVHTLTVVADGTGSGIVTSFPAGIDCGNDCESMYSQGTEVTLTAIPAVGSVFSGWSGDADCIDGLLTMDADKNCIAAFDSTQPPENACAQPLPGMVAWWPFDENDGPLAIDIARANDGWYRNNPGLQAIGDGSVAQSRRFDGVDDYVEVPDDPSLNFGRSQEFSIALRVRTEGSTENNFMTLVDKRSQSMNGGGYQLFLQDGALGLRLNDGDMSLQQPFTDYINGGTFVADGKWHFVAVTVGRRGFEGGRWYLNGEEVGTFDTADRTGSLKNSATLRIGRRSFDDSSSAIDPAGYFTGMLDEIAIYDRVLTTKEIRGLFNAGSLGQCKENIYVAMDTPVCANASEGAASIAICNYSTTPQSYEASFFGMPLDECNADVAGSTVFEVHSNIGVVTPETCKPSQVNLGWPGDETSDGLNMCYRVTSGQQSTAAYLWRNRKWCAAPLDTAPIDLPEGEMTRVSFEVTNISSSTRTLQYEFQAMSSDGEGLEDPLVSFNGQLPGEIAFGEITLAAGESREVFVDVEILDFRPFVFHHVRLRNSATGAGLASVGIRSTAESCVHRQESLCLNDKRFRVEVSWKDARGHAGSGQAVPLTNDTGYLWFFNESNVELVVKVLDGRRINGRWWVFYGSLSNVEYTITVTDTRGNVSREYFNPSGSFASAGDIDAFPGDSKSNGSESTGARVDLFTADSVLVNCTDSTNLCLGGDRFNVEVEWEDSRGNRGDGQAVSLTDDTGFFWFFSKSNVELIVKILDGRKINGHWWVFYGALSNVDYTMKVTDTKTGQSRVYVNTNGVFASRGDTEAFSEE